MSLIEQYWFGRIEATTEPNELIRIQHERDARDFPSIHLRAARRLRELRQTEAADAGNSLASDNVHR